MESSFVSLKLDLEYLSLLLFFGGLPPCEITFCDFWRPGINDIHPAITPSKLCTGLNSTFGFEVVDNFLLFDFLSLFLFLSDFCLCLDLTEDARLDIRLSLKMLSCTSMSIDFCNLFTSSFIECWMQSNNFDSTSVNFSLTVEIILEFILLPRSKVKSPKQV